jgi:hypothetical protein
MHRISLALADTCVYKEQKLQLAGLNIRARVGSVWVAGKQVIIASYRDLRDSVDKVFIYSANLLCLLATPRLCFGPRVPSTISFFSCRKRCGCSMMMAR